MANKLNGFLCQWRSFMMFFDGRPLPGPFTKLLQALSRIGWSVQKPPFVIDHEGLVHNILVTPRPLLRARLEHAWLRFVALAHRHRDTMRDITGIEPTLLHRDADSLTPVNAARLASLRAGAFIFGPQQAKFDVTQTGFCAQCQVPDDAEHQVSHCPRFSDIRQQHLWVCARWPMLPVSFTHHLLPPENPHMPLLRSLLHNLCDASGVFFCSGHGTGWQHLFTDGSCADPDGLGLALAAWGVIHAASICSARSLWPCSWFVTDGASGRALGGDLRRAMSTPATTPLHCMVGLPTCGGHGARDSDWHALEPLC